MSEPTTCRRCGRQIIFALSPDGKPLPVDARPITAYVIEPDGEGQRAVRVRDKFPDLQEPIFVSHFVTCPNAAEFSGGRRPA